MKRRIVYPRITNPTPKPKPRWGIFHWNVDTHHYREENAIRIYARQSAAEKAANKMNGFDTTSKGIFNDVVVRPI